MKSILIGLIAIEIFTTPAFAAEIKPFVSNGELGVILQGLNFPKGLPRDLGSGLTNKIVLRIELTSGVGSSTPTILQKFTEVTVKYELWEEKYTLQITDADGAVKKSIAEKNIVLAMLGGLRIPKLLNVSNTVKTQSFKVRFEAFLNPVEKEKMEKIREWVVQNSNAAPGSATNSSIGSTTRKNTLFNQIFEQFAGGERVAALWRESGESPVFKLSEVSDAK